MANAWFVTLLSNGLLAFLLVWIKHDSNRLRTVAETPADDRTEQRTPSAFSPTVSAVIPGSLPPTNASPSPSPGPPPSPVPPDIERPKDGDEGLATESREEPSLQSPSPVPSDIERSKGDHEGLVNETREEPRRTERPTIHVKAPQNNQLFSHLSDVGVHVEASDGFELVVSINGAIIPSVAIVLLPTL